MHLHMWCYKILLNTMVNMGVDFVRIKGSESKNIKGFVKFINLSILHLVREATWWQWILIGRKLFSTADSSATIDFTWDENREFLNPHLSYYFLVSIDFYCPFLDLEMFILCIYIKIFLEIYQCNLKNIVYLLRFRFHPVNTSIIIFFSRYIKLYMRKNLGYLDFYT